MGDYGLKQEVLDFIRQAARECGLTKVVLFGSRATGRFGAKSDIDLALSGGRLHDFEGLMEERCPTLLFFDFVDLSCAISDDLRNRIASEGVLLYG